MTLYNPQKQYCNIPLRLIMIACADEWVDTLAYYLMIKGIKEKPTFVNYNSRMIGNALDVSHTCINKHINIMIEKGLAYKKGRDLKFFGVNKLCAVYSSKPIKYCIKKTKTENVNEIRDIRVIRQLHAQSYHIERSETIINKCSTESGKISKADRSYIKKNSPDKSVSGLIASSHNHNGLPWLSNKQFGELFNLGKTSGSLIHRRMKNNGVIVSCPHYLEINEAEALGISNNNLLFRVLLSRIEDGDDCGHVFMSHNKPNQNFVRRTMAEFYDGWITEDEMKKRTTPEKILHIRLANSVIPIKYSYHKRELTLKNTEEPPMDDSPYSMYIQEYVDNEYFNNNSKNRNRDIKQYNKLISIIKTILSNSDSFPSLNILPITKKFTSEKLNDRFYMVNKLITTPKYVSKYIN